ncbi:16S rRNA (cytosine(1402)-N(4))-methyltransferase RsmH [Chloroflexota bacterium]
MTQEHTPVLFDEVLTGLQVRPGGRYIDATLGASGHSVGILHASSPDGQLLGLDADPDAIRFSSQQLRVFGDRAAVRVTNFRHLQAEAALATFVEVDGILLDLGLSSRQLADATRGFAFSHDGPLDMRLDPGQSLDAASLVNRLPEADLAEILWRYGDERRSRRIAKAIVAARPLDTTRQLAGIVTRALGSQGRIHPATRTFQALRIAVNSELDALEAALPQTRDLLRPGGRVAVIAFHSLEDRLVKNFFRQEATDCICPPELPICQCQHKATLSIITRKPMRPSDAEIARNPRSRSARLRIAERLGTVASRRARA